MVFPNALAKPRITDLLAAYTKIDYKPIYLPIPKILLDI